MIRKLIVCMHQHPFVMCFFRSHTLHLLFFPLFRIPRFLAASSRRPFLFFIAFLRFAEGNWLRCFGRDGRAENSGVLHGIIKNCESIRPRRMDRKELNKTKAEQNTESRRIKKKEKKRKIWENVELMKVSWTMD